jgi:DNA-binding LacI/PurR family transcriptional regulator
VTAWVGSVDTVGYNLCRRLTERGVRVPEDVSVIGYDDLPVAGYVDPPLTTVHQPMREVGALAADVLLDLITGLDREPGPHLLPASLVVRKSTAPPRA